MYVGLHEGLKHYEPVTTDEDQGTPLPGAERTGENPPVLTERRAGAQQGPQHPPHTLPYPPLPSRSSRSPPYFSQQRVEGPE